jgi:pimeloyl-ACP methyl ester carboxylesterase
MDTPARGEASGRVSANGIEIAYETFGSSADPPIVLVMGLGAQMIMWPDQFCRDLADSGYFVVRFDNRDVGRSSHLESAGRPSLLRLILRRRPPYRIDDMAGDVIGLVDALGLDRVHLVGASMGGFIVQTVALQHAGRVRSITLIMTSTGSRRVGRAKPRVFFRLMGRRTPSDRTGVVARTLETFRLIGSPGYPFDEGHLRDVAERSYERAFDPDGQLRQLSAALAQPNRTAELSSIVAPTLVVHGLDDPLVGLTGGLALATSIPRAKLVGYHGMGHDLPRELWSDLVSEISSLAARADAPASTPG